MSTNSSTPAEVAVLDAGNLKHGLNAESIVLPAEVENDWLAHLDEVIDQYSPTTPVERALTYRVAELFWRLRRAARAERNAVNNYEADTERTHGSRFAPGSTRHAVLAIPEQPTLDAVIRYEGHLNRMLFQTLHELEALQASRSGKSAPLARVQIHGGGDIST
jgi:hypothetical protein